MWQPSRHLVSWLLQGTYRGNDLPQHLAAIRRLEPRKEEVYEHEYLYSCLSVLDAKAQVLLGYDALLMAAASIVLSVFPDGAPLGRGLIVAALAASGASSVLCLPVVWVQWTDTTEFERPEHSFKRLLLISNKRTISYRVAWVIAHLAAVLLIVGAPLQ
jgi:hypothetical protein